MNDERRLLTFRLPRRVHVSLFLLFRLSLLTNPLALGDQVRRVRAKLGLSNLSTLSLTHAFLHLFLLRS